MFRPRPDAEKPAITVFVDGRPVRVPAGASAVAAALAAGWRSIRQTPVSGSERGAYCMIGVCFDCLAEIDGVPNQQSCMVEARPRMQIRRQRRARFVRPLA